MSNRFFDPLAQFLDNSGNVLSGGKLNFYETGTSTRTDTYTTPLEPDGGQTANANPVVLNSAGRLPNDVFLDPNVTYKVVLTDADDVTIWTADPVVDPAANVTAAIQVFAGDPNGNVAGNAGAVGGSGASMVWDTTNNLMYVCTTTGTADTAVWTQVTASLTGEVNFTGVISPSSLSSDQNNYDPTGLSGASIIRQDASSDVTVTGLAGGAKGRIIFFENIASSSKITLAQSNASSSAANRFLIGKDNLVLYPDQAAILVYDDTSDRWRVFGTAPDLVRETGQATTTGTAFDFSDIPAGVSEIVVMFNVVSLSGTDNLLVQIGDSGGLVTTGYGAGTDINGTVTSSTTGYIVGAGGAARNVNGILRLARVGATAWVSTHNVWLDSSTMAFGAGRVNLSAELDRLRITRTGTDSFDNGSVNVIYHL